MPPEFPKPGYYDLVLHCGAIPVKTNELNVVNRIKMAHLFRLLRPEYVRTYPKPLCSDAFRYEPWIQIHVV
jgi:hypothetical protein